MRAVLEDAELVHVAAVVREEELDDVGVADDHRGEEHGLGQFLEVFDRHHVFELLELAHRNAQRQHHRAAREDGAGHEVGREDGGVPARHQTHREVPRHDRVHREHQRRGETGQERVEHVVVAPLALGPDPAQRKRAIDVPAHAARVALDDGEVGDEPHVEEHDADRQVRADREHVPLQRRLEIGR